MSVPADGPPNDNPPDEENSHRLIQSRRSGRRSISVLALERVAEAVRTMGKQALTAWDTADGGLSRAWSMMKCSFSPGQDGDVGIVA
jgi:hypothetical protein